VVVEGGSSALAEESRDRRSLKKLERNEERNRVSKSWTKKGNLRQRTGGAVSGRTWR